MGTFQAFFQGAAIFSEAETCSTVIKGGPLL